MSQVALRPENDRTSINAVAFGRGDTGGQIAPQNLGDIVRFAEVMSKADIAIPKHLRSNPGACLAVCMQAFQWQMDPFAVAQKSYDVGGRMAYEAQLIAAVINTRAGLAKRPAIEYRGSGNDRQCVVTFEADDGSVHVYESPRFGTITPKNSPLWKSDPDQQLAYYSVRAGARRHFPEVILGVYDRDEIVGAKDVTPEARPSLSQRLTRTQGPASDRTEGFSRDFVQAETGVRQEGAGEAAEWQSDPSSDVGSDPSSEVGDEKRPEDFDSPAPQGAEGGDEIDPADEREPGLPDEDQEKITRYARDMLAIATGDVDPGLKKDRMAKAHTRWRGDFDKLSEAGMDAAQRVFKAIQLVATGKSPADETAQFVAAEIGCEADALAAEAA